MAKIKLWITDIDGTIMDYNGNYSNRLIKTIDLLQKNDIKCALATGRMYMGAKFAADELKVKSPVVCYQGALIKEVGAVEGENKILWASPLKNEFVYEITDYLRKKKIHTHIYNNDILYVEDDDKKIMEEYCSYRGTTYQTINFDDLKLGCVSKMLAVILDENLMQEVKFELKEKYEKTGQLKIVQSAKTYLEITDINASKGKALDFLKQYWNIKEDEIIASGDQDNDIDMLLAAKYRICVGKRSEKLYNIAQYHCKEANSEELFDIIKNIIEE